MKKLLVIIAVLALFVTAPGVVFAASSGPLGPAPNAGDGIPDGSDFYLVSIQKSMISG